jgi:hypothetical protein
MWMMRTPAHQTIYDEPTVRMPLLHALEQAHARLERISPIFELVFQETDCFEFTRQFDFLHDDVDCRRPVRGGAKLARRLAAKFPRKDLEEAGIIDRDHDASIVLHPGLTSGDGPLLFLRNSQGKLFDVVMADEKCCTGAYTLFAMVHDEQTRQNQMVDRSYANRLMGVVTMFDVAVLRAMGVAAVPVTCLERLPAPFLRGMIELVGARSSSCIMNTSPAFNADLPDDYTTNYIGEEPFPRAELQIVSGVQSSPTSSEVERLNAVVDNLKRASRYLDVSWENINVWWPTDADRDELAYRLSLRKPELLQEYFHKERSVHSLDSIDSGEGPPPAPSPAAALGKAMHDIVNPAPRFDDVPGEHEERRRMAVDDYRRLIEKQFVQPQIAKAIQNPDPVEGQLELLFAQTFQRAQQLAPAVHQQLSESIQQALEGSKEMENTEIQRQCTRHTKDLLRMASELRG